MSQCSVCNKEITIEDPAVLAMGGAGIPRYLCEDCEALLDAATLSKDHEEAGAAIGKLSKIMADGDPDPVTFAMINNLLLKASDRAVAIKEGKYDFALDEQTSSDDEIEDLPEELLESEEDKEKDRIDEEKQKKFDKVYNIILAIVCSAFVAIFIWKLIENFFIK